MPFISKGNNRQTGTPSPTPGDFLNTLLIVKDTVNATLLTEHTRIADLSNTLTDVEDQIRSAVELTIKNLKTEYEKRKRKTVPGIKRLQDSLKSLSKSESKCKASERYCKNADAKKAKRRIKDANKTLQEYTSSASSDTNFGISAFVADQITLLCQQLMQIPPKTNRHETKDDPLDFDRGEKSDSDSQGSSRVNTPTSHIYTEIDVHHARNSTYITPRRATYLLPNEIETSNLDNSDKGTLSTRLNSVVLFSSDSEEDYGFGDKRSNDCKKRPKSAGNESRKSRSHKKNQKPKTGSPDYEILNKPTSSDVFRRCGYIDKSPLRSRLSPNRRSISPVTYDDYEKPIKREIESLGAPIKEYIKRMSPSCEHSNTDITNKPNFYHEQPPYYGKSTNTSAKDNYETLTPASRSPPKRYLPATPKLTSEDNINKNTPLKSSIATCRQLNEDNIDQIDAVCMEDTADAFTMSSALNTVELLSEAEDLISKTHILEKAEQTDNSNHNSILNCERTSHREQSVSYENDYIDVDEIKFRETVRSARREIMNTLKSKYHNDKDNMGSTNLSQVRANSKVGDVNETNNSINFKNTLSADDQLNNMLLRDTKYFENKDRRNRNLQMHAKSFGKTSSGIYQSKLIHTYETQNTNLKFCTSDKEEANKSSLVTSAIEKFEKASLKNDTAIDLEKRLKPVVRYGFGGRFRSASEPRTSVTHLHDKSKTDMPNYTKTNKALEVRIPVHNHTVSRYETDDSENVGDSLNMSKSCTENDLVNLVTSENSSSIRRQWSKRRSSSVTPRVDDFMKSSTPVYKCWGKFSIPEHTSPCFISAIVVLEDRSVVLLDQFHSCIHLFDRTFRHKDQYRLLEKSKGCVQVDSFTVAVAFPYKRCVSTFCIKMGAILTGNETSLACSEWIVDIAYSKPLLYVLCKAGEIHILSENGSEYKRLRVDMNGKLFIPPSGKRLFILGEGRISKFDANGVFISSKADIDAHSMIYLENKIYVADRQKHKLVPLSGTVDRHNLIDVGIEFPTAVGSSINGDFVFVSQFEESMDCSMTRSVTVFKLQKE